MTRLQRSIRRPAGERGFTLIELLVVIIILGILAAVVVFAVNGVDDKGKSSAVAIDKRTLKTAEEAYCAKNGRYADGTTLVAEGFLSDEPEYHEVYALPNAGGTCNGWKYSILQTAEAGAYPPGQWATTDAPPANMYPVFAVRLADGRVLVGGWDLVAGVSLTAIWNPVAPTSWTMVDPYPETIRTHITASSVLLMDDPSTPSSECALGTVNNCGKVLVREKFLFDPTQDGLGASEPQWQTLDTPAGCYLCSPGTYAFTPRNMIQIKGSPSSCYTMCGKIMMTGDNQAGGTRMALIYDPRDNTFLEIPYNISSDTAIYNGYLTQLTDGRVLFCCMGDGFTPGSYFFDPQALAWSPGPTPPSLYFRFTGFGDDASGNREPTPVLPNGELFFGSDPLVTPGSAGIYTAESGGQGAFRQVPGCGTTDRCNVLGSLVDGRVIGRDGLSNATFVFNPVSSAWDPAGDLIGSADPGSINSASVLLDPAGGPCGSNCGKMFVAGLGVAQLFTP